MSDWGRKLEDKAVGPDVLGKMIGGGGYGKVFAVQGQPDVVVKVMQDKKSFLKELSNLDTLKEIFVEDRVWPARVPTAFPRPIAGFFAGSLVMDVPHPTVFYVLKMGRLPCGTLKAHEDVYPWSFSEADVVRIVGQIVLACRIIGRHGYAHNDLSFNNIAFQAGTHAVTLIDFGLMDVFGSEKFSGSPAWRSLRYVQRAPEDDEKGPITMFSDVEAALYTGFMLLGLEWTQVDELKLHPFALSVALRKKRDTPLVAALELFLARVQAADAEETAFKFDGYLYDRVVVPGLKSLWEAVGMQSEKQLYDPIHMKMFDSHDAPEPKRSRSEEEGVECDACGKRKLTPRADLA